MPASEQSWSVQNKLTWHEPAIFFEKPAFGQRSTSKKVWPQWVVDLSLQYGHVILVSRYLVQVSIAHNMDVQYQRSTGKPRLHVSINLSFGLWQPCCATQSPPSCVCAHEQYRCPWQPWENQFMGFLFPIWLWGSAWRPEQSSAIISRGSQGDDFSCNWLNQKLIERVWSTMLKGLLTSRQKHYYLLFNDLVQINKVINYPVCYTVFVLVWTSIWEISFYKVTVKTKQTACRDL